MKFAVLFRTETLSNLIRNRYSSINSNYLLPLAGHTCPAKYLMDLEIKLKTNISFFRNQNYFKKIIYPWLYSLWVRSLQFTGSCNLHPEIFRNQQVKVRSAHLLGKVPSHCCASTVRLNIAYNRSRYAKVNSTSFSAPNSHFWLTTPH